MNRISHPTFLKRNSGFTLMEMVLTLIILSILSIVGAHILGNTYKAYFTARDLIPLTSQGEVTMERMLRELQGGRCATLTQPSGTATLQFNNYENNTILFNQSSSTLYMKTNTLSPDLLAQDILANSLTFTLLSNCRVRIQFTLNAPLTSFSGGGTIEIPFRTTAYVRNNT
ncbi:MAG: prepilin-type N-terminal cleavage/methylation domain-containing protein [Magnetococcus sp. DMHC-6]